MKRINLLLILLILFGSGVFFCPAQEDTKTATSYSYDPGGRRDPFKSLVGGKEVRDKTTIGGIADLSIDDLQLIGITKTKGKFEAIFSITKGFPFPLKEGDKLSDGYILTIKENQVVFRKLSEKGLPLLKPKDVVREISVEE